MTASSASVVAFSLARMSITSTSFRAGLVAVGLMVAALTVRMIRRHRLILSVVLGIVTLAMVAANVGAAINAHYDYLPSLQSLSSHYRGEDQATWSAARAARHEVQRSMRSVSSPVVTPASDRTPVVPVLRAASARSIAPGVAPSATPPARAPAVRLAPRSTPSRTVAPSVRPPGARGLLVRVPIAGLVSHYRGRAAEIYLPPAWVSDPSIRLPVLFLLHGSPGSPVDWARSARADRVSDEWAARHHGLAPILVMPDVNGSFWADSECTDGTAGNVDTYLSIDVANWVAGHLRPSLDHRHWGIGGLSEGGTCAVSLALRHPTVFETFLDYAGEDHISRHGGALSLFSGTDAQRRVQLAGYDPYALASHLTDPQQMSGWFEVGGNDHQTNREMQRLAATMARRGFPVQFHVRPGFRHNFHFFRPAFAGSYEWMAMQLGTDPNTAVPVGRLAAPNRRSGEVQHPFRARGQRSERGQ